MFKNNVKIEMGLTIEAKFDGKSSPKINLGTKGFAWLPKYGINNKVMIIISIK